MTQASEKGGPVDGCNVTQSENCEWCIVCCIAQANQIDVIQFTNTRCAKGFRCGDQSITDSTWLQHWRTGPDWARDSHRQRSCGAPELRWSIFVDTPEGVQAQAD